ncbi:3-hydroxyacyl-CoA dehydrogenase [Phycomyces nitens]|nr:3-hydroxyacyl-CoA dehydrogenase [Phycomyces nitens]
MQIKGNTFVVTGGASGLGEQVVRDIVAQGANVIIIDINHERAEFLIKELGNQVYSHGITDTTSETLVNEALDGGITNFPDSPFVGAILCGGILSPQKDLKGYGPDEKLTGYSQFKNIVTVNVLGTYNVAQQVAQRMMSNNEMGSDKERGVIITVSSICGLDGILVAYGTSKAAIAGLTLPLARELAEYGIRVMSIAPGPFNTPILKKTDIVAPHCLFPRRNGESDEFSKLVINIIGTPMLNGSVIRLDGGLRT